MNKLQNSDNCLKTKQERIVKYSLVKRSYNTGTVTQSIQHKIWYRDIDSWILIVAILWELTLITQNAETSNKEITK